MRTYRVDQHQIGKPAKGVELADGYEITSNDGTIKIRLLHITVMDGGMESGFYHTVMRIKEGTGWTEVSDIQNYNSKEKFLETIKDIEEFSQAYSELMTNNHINE